jgi:hypothetical protein
LSACVALSVRSLVGGKQPVPLCSLAAQALSKPKDVSRHHPQESFFRLIMPVTKPLIPRPMHAFGPWRKSVEKARIASKPLSDFLCLDLVAVAQRCLPRGIGELVAMPTPPWLIPKRMELFDGAATVTDKIESLPPKATRDASRAQDLLAQNDIALSPMRGMNADRIGFVTPNPPVPRWTTDIAGTPQSPDVNRTGLFYRPAPVAAPPAHDRNPLEIFLTKNCME